MILLERVESRRHAAWQVVWFAVWVGVTGVGLYLKPDPAGHGTHQQLGLPPCPSVLLFDRPCPGCGLTTSWTALLHGNLAFAFHAHPFGPLLYFLFTLSAWLGLYGFAKCRALVLDSPQMSRALAVSGVVFLAFGLVRMALTPHFRTLEEQLVVESAGHR